MQSGTTATTAFRHGDELIVANVGDSRAVGPFIRQRKGGACIPAVRATWRARCALRAQCGFVGLVHGRFAAQMFGFVLCEGAG